MNVTLIYKSRVIDGGLLEDTQLAYYYAYNGNELGDRSTVTPDRYDYAYVEWQVSDRAGYGQQLDAVRAEHAPLGCHITLDDITGVKDIAQMDAQSIRKAGGNHLARMKEEYKPIAR